MEAFVVGAINFLEVDIQFFPIRESDKGGTQLSLTPCVRPSHTLKNITQGGRDSTESHERQCCIHAITQRVDYNLALE